MSFRLSELPVTTLTASEWDNLRRCQRKPRLDCHAAFTATEYKEIWAFASFGKTPPDWRFSVRGWIAPLDEIADLLLATRGQTGGRFFITHGRYAYWKEEEKGLRFRFLEYL